MTSAIVGMSGDLAAELRVVTLALSSVQERSTALAARLSAKDPQAVCEEVEAQVRSVMIG